MPPRWEHCLTAADIGDVAQLHGLVAFLFAYDGAGTPAIDQFLAVRQKGPVSDCRAAVRGVAAAAAAVGPPRPIVGRLRARRAGLRLLDPAPGGWDRGFGRSATCSAAS